MTSFMEDDPDHCLIGPGFPGETIVPQFRKAGLTIPGPIVNLMYPRPLK